MKSNIIKAVMAAALLSLLPSVLKAQDDTLRLSTRYTTHIVFSSDVSYADRSDSQNVLSKIVERNRNIIALRAKEPFTEPSSVTALESSGRMWAFIVVYDDSPEKLIVDTRESHGTSGSASTWKRGTVPTLAEIDAMGRSLYHIEQSAYEVTVSCTNILSSSDITFLSLSVRNASGISWGAPAPSFVIESRRKAKRSVSYDRPVIPKSSHGSMAAAPGTTSSAVYSFDKLTLTNDQALKVYLYEEPGQRNIVLTISADDINRARGVLPPDGDGRSAKRVQTGEKQKKSKNDK